MSRPPLRALLFLRLACVLALAPGVGESSGVLAADEIDTLVRLRISPGAVALLVGHGSDPRVVLRLKEGLADKNPAVRGAAARVAAVQRIVVLVPELKEMVPREQEAEPAREEIRALCTLAGQTADLEALKAVRRFSPRLDGFFTRLIGRLRGPRSWALYSSDLRHLSLSPSDRRAYFRLASREEPREVLTLAGVLALRESATKDWRAILAVAAEREVTLDEGVLIAALQGQDALVGGEAAWYLARSYRRRPPEDPSRVLGALKEAPPIADPELRFGSEMLNRVLGRPAREDEGWISCLESNPECHLDSEFADSPLVDLLTEREREALTRRNSKSGRVSKNPAVSAGRSSTPNPPGQRDLHLISGLPNGVTSDLLAVGRCRSSRGTHLFSVAGVEFGMDGLPRMVHMSPHEERACQQTAAALFLMSTAPDELLLEGSKGDFLAVFHPAALVCEEEADLRRENEGAETETRLVRGRVTAPKLKTRVEPFYPMDSRRQGHEGVSVYEAIISRTGCVREVRLVKSSYQELDAVGMEAIAQWRYTPATLDGRSVRVYLTVTVTYSLKK